MEMTSDSDTSQALGQKQHQMDQLQPLTCRYF